MRALRLIVSTSILIATTNFAHTQVSGTVFRDYNGDGVRQAAAGYTEPLVAGVTVKAFNATDVVLATATTTTTGTYSFSAGQVASGTAVRIEFTIPASGSCDALSSIDYPGGSGAVYGTSVRFLTAGASATNVNFTINNPADYQKQSAPFSGVNVFSTIMYAGDPAGGGTSGTAIAMYKFPYSNKGNSSASNGTLPPNATDLATNAQIGTCYGVAYSRQADKVFTSAFMKRHAGFGPANGIFNNAPGAIYIVNPNLTSTTSAASYFTSLDALGFATHNSTGLPVYGSGGAFSYTISGTGIGATISYTATGSGGQGVIGSNATRGLPAAKTTQSMDPAAFGQIGKVSLGALELSDDGNNLYVINLYDRKLYSLRLNNAASPASVSSTTGYSLPSPPLRSASGLPGAAVTYTGATDGTSFYDGTKGVQRPFAVKYYRGKVYVGTVTTGENGGTSTADNNTGNVEFTDLWAYVWVFDPVAGTFSSTPVLQTPLNFARGINGDGQNENWRPWTNTFPTPWATGAPRYTQYQQPIFSDIEFDRNGSMILGFRDRFGDQSAYDELTMNDATRIAPQAMGDLYRAYYNQSTCAFEIEVNGKEGTNGSVTTAGANNGMGPSNYSTNNGEFYFRDEVYDGNSATQIGTFHLNCTMGGLALIKGTDSVATSSMDPMRAWSGGVSWFSGTTGDNGRDYEMYAGTGAGNFPTCAVGDPGKANGLGDIEFTGYLPTLEIGHRVWADANGNGKQDAGEAGIAGVEVQLVTQSGGTVIATCTTDASGFYFFISGGVATTGTGSVTCNLLPGTNYFIRIKGTITANKNITGNAGLNNTRFLTFANVSGNGATGYSDNDGANGTTGSFYQATITSGSYGQNSQNIDFGFAPNNVLPLQLLAFDAVLNGNKIDLKWKVAFAGDGDHYVAEYSTDGVSFRELKTIPASLLTDYAATQNNPSSGSNYFRIKLVNKDGSYFYSSIRKVEIKRRTGILMYPNPATNNLTIDISPDLAATNLYLTVFSNDGKMVMKKALPLNSTLYQLNIQPLSKGHYTVLVADKAGNTKSSQLVQKQ